MTMEEAADAYLAIAKRYNKRIDQLARKYGDQATLKQRRREWLSAAEAVKVFTDSLKGLTWPVQVAPEIEKLIRLNVVDEARCRAVARAAKSGWPALLDAANEAAKSSRRASDQAAVVRDILGLPSN